MSWQLALAGLAPLPLVAYSSVWYHRTIAPRYTAVRARNGEVNARLENSVSGIAVVKSFTAEAFEAGRVAEASRQSSVTYGEFASMCGINP